MIPPTPPPMPSMEMSPNASPDASADTHGAALQVGGLPDEPMLVEVMTRLAAQVSGPLTQASDRVTAFAHSGRIDRASLLALGRDIDQARQAGLMGQRIARLAGGQARPGIERVDLAAVLQSVLNELAGRAGAGAPGHRQHIAARAQVMGDASLLHSVVEAAACWADALATGTIEWTLDTDPWPPTASVHCRFEQAAPQPEDDGSALLSAPVEESLHWLMLGYAGHLAGVTANRTAVGRQHRLTLRFRHLANDVGGEDAASALDSPQGARALLSGCQILLVSARRELRQRLREALRGHEVFVDHVQSVAAAEHYCDDGAPQVLVYESSFEGDALRRLRARLAELRPPVTVVELVPDSSECHAGGRDIRLGREALAASLGPALVMAQAITR